MPTTIMTQMRMQHWYFLAFLAFSIAPCTCSEPAAMYVDAPLTYYHTEGRGAETGGQTTCLFVDLPPCAVKASPCRAR